MLSNVGSSKIKYPEFCLFVLSGHVSRDISICFVTLANRIEYFFFFDSVISCKRRIVNTTFTVVWANETKSKWKNNKKKRLWREIEMRQKEDTSIWVILLLIAQNKITKYR